MDASEPIALSALQHWQYCPRQCGLIHLEQVFDDNVHTLRGQAVRARTDRPGVETAKGVRVERALPLWHDALGLIGSASQPAVSRLKELLADPSVKLAAQRALDKIGAK